MRPLSLFVAAMTIFAADSAPAYTIVPEGDGEAARIVVLIERDYGDLVPISALPPPYNQIVQTAQGPEGLVFRWRYFRSDEDGLFYIRVDEDGAGTAIVELTDPDPIAGDRLGAATVFVDHDGNALHAVLVRADISPDAATEGQGQVLKAEIALDREPQWWREVDALAFLTMKYYQQQAPSDAGVWEAMERAVERFTEGRGTSERVMAK